MVPEIETKRLRLRAIRESDLDVWAGVTSDPAIIRYLGGVAQSREETWRRLLTSAGAWSILGYGYWAVERRDEGRMIGHLGFADFKRDMPRSIEGLPEMGWVFAPEGQGQGYASEAVDAALAWADQALAGQSFAAIIDPANERSIRLAEKSGFIRSAETLYREAPILIFRRPAAHP